MRGRPVAGLDLQGAVPGEITVPCDQVANLPDCAPLIEQHRAEERERGPPPRHVVVEEAKAPSEALVQLAADDEPQRARLEVGERERPLERDDRQDLTLLGRTPLEDRQRALGLLAPRPCRIAGRTSLTMAEQGQRPLEAQAPAGGAGRGVRHGCGFLGQPYRQHCLDPARQQAQVFAMERVVAARQRSMIESHEASRGLPAGARSLGEERPDRADERHEAQLRTTHDDVQTTAIDGDDDQAMKCVEQRLKLGRPQSGAFPVALGTNEEGIRPEMLDCSAKLSTIIDLEELDVGFAHEQRDESVAKRPRRRRSNDQAKSFQRLLSNNVPLGQRSRGSSLAPCPSAHYGSNGAKGEQGGPRSQGQPGSVLQAGFIGLGCSSSSRSSWGLLWPTPSRSSECGTGLSRLAQDVSQTCAITAVGFRKKALKARDSGIAVGTPIAGRACTDPDVRHARIRLRPRALDRKALAWPGWRMRRRGSQSSASFVRG